MENFEGRLGCGRLFDLADNQPPRYGRIGYEWTANADEVEFLFRQGFDHATRRSEAASNHDRHAGDSADGARELDEVSFPLDGAFWQFVFAFVLDRYADELGLFERASRQFQQIERSVIQPSNKLDAFGIGEAALLEIGGVQFDADRKIRTYRASNCVYNREQKPRSALQWPSPAIGSTIGERAEELRDQISVGGMQLDTGETCAPGILRSESKLTDRVVDVRFRHLAGFGEAITKTTPHIDLYRRW